jgi:hypothetical protein
MAVHPYSSTPHSGRNRGLAAGLFAPPIAVLANIEIAYALVPGACASRNTLPLHLVNAVCLAVTIGAALMAWRYWKAVGLGWPEDDGTPLARSRFIAGIAVLLGGLCVLVLVAQWIAVFLLDPCQ